MKTDREYKKRRVVLWLSVVLYAFSLPYAIVVYDTITLKFSREIAGIIPCAVLLVAGLVYIIYSLKAKLSIRSMALLIPCSLIAGIIMYCEPNPNKHIHIPEYILMSWLVFEALRVDYRGSGIFLLVFLCSSLFGVLDEILQGVHPARFYGWNDMLINSTSSFIGVLSIMGLRKSSGEGWKWLQHVKEKRGFLLLLLGGLVSTAVNCSLLFKVKRHGGFWNLYPDLLILWDAVFVVFVLVVLLILSRKGPGPAGDHADRAMTATLWILVPVITLFVMHGVIVVCRLADIPFR